MRKIYISGPAILMSVSAYHGFYTGGLRHVLSSIACPVNVAYAYD